VSKVKCGLNKLKFVLAVGHLLSAENNDSRGLVLKKLYTAGLSSQPTANHIVRFVERQQ